MSKYNIWTFFLWYNRRKCKMRRNGCIAAEQKHYFWSNCFCSFLTSMPGGILDFVYTTWSNANNWTVQNNAKNSYISSITSKSKDMIFCVICCQKIQALRWYYFGISSIKCKVTASDMGWKNCNTIIDHIDGLMLLCNDVIFIGI